MALKACFQVSTIASSAAATTGTWALPAHRPFFIRDKFHLPAATGHRKSVSSPPSTSTGDDGRRSRVTCRAKKTVDEVLVVVDANWENLVAASDKPVLVEFWAPWCGPCRMIAPVIKELARDYAGKIVCCQVNTDDCPGIASRFGIRSIPTVLVFKNGEKKESVIGAVPKSTLVSVVDKYLEGS
ncbi:thioredoxin M-type, chloroplastic-like [Musa acuminata AAA Group]|uniref:thioredoxin M-type, chloroplastic-like n=1 Tax=Musa acuminata AAA Group TaxID=214697 RepID=UPI0031D22253